MSMTSIQRYVAPRSLDEAVRILDEGDATLLAGGTDLMPQTRAGVRDFRPTLINLRHIPELTGVGISGDMVRIGPLTTVATIAASDLLRNHARVLLETADCFGSSQIRNTATVGGNICNASPAGDMIVPLLLLDAEVELSSWTGTEVSHRKINLRDFFLGPGQTRLARNEILSSIYFRSHGATWVAGFRKFGGRPALDIAIVSVGLAGRRYDGVLLDVRVAFGAVAPTPMRGLMTEAALEEKVLSPENVAAIAKTAQDEVIPISDVRASAWYRKELVKTLTGRLLNDVARM